MTQQPPDSALQKATVAQLDAQFAPPQLVLMTEAQSDLVHVLEQPGVLDALVRGNFGVALSLAHLDATRAAAAALLAARGIRLVAWLALPNSESGSFSAQNYPQLLARYRAFRAWQAEHQLHFAEIGLTIAPPAEVLRGEIFSTRYLARRLWRASDNVLFPAARAACLELVAAMRHDGYGVHVIEWPVVVDDRLAGTDLVQRALEVVDVPADLSVLGCTSVVPARHGGGDVGGALIAGYGPAADAIALSGAEVNGLAWPALRRDLLLAARHTDIIYLETLEGCIERALLTPLTTLDWRAPARAAWWQHIQVRFFRALLVTTLAVTRFGPRVLGWAGWMLAGILWLRGRRK